MITKVKVDSDPIYLDNDHDDFKFGLIGVAIKNCSLNFVRNNDNNNT